MLKQTRTILETLDDPELIGRLLSRREALHSGGQFGLKLAFASVPLGLAALARPAFAQDGLPQQIVDVLNFALTLEFLEAEFYTTGLGTAGLIPAEQQPIFDLIRVHENAHVMLLQSVLGDQAVEKPEFDFTAGGTFATFEDPDTFRALAQGFEDTGVRAYKGQITEFIEHPQLLQTAAQIHSVEARHAARIRRLRGLKETITLADTDVPALQPIYQGEEQTVQAGFDVTTAQGVDADAASEAFDEPLSMEDVLSIVDQFIVS